MHPALFSNIPPSRRGVSVGPYGPEAAIPIPDSIASVLCLLISALCRIRFCSVSTHSAFRIPKSTLEYLCPLWPQLCALRPKLSAPCLTTWYHYKRVSSILLDTFSVQHKWPVLSGAPQLRLVVIMGAHKISRNSRWYYP